MSKLFPPHRLSNYFIGEKKGIKRYEKTEVQENYYISLITFKDMHSEYEIKVFNLSHTFDVQTPTPYF